MPDSGGAAVLLMRSPLVGVGVLMFLLAFIAVLNALTRTGESLATLMKPMHKYVSSGERNFVNPDKDATLRKLQQQFAEVLQVVHLFLAFGLAQRAIGQRFDFIAHAVCSCGCACRAVAPGRC